ncbi:hypothetical protein Droror1_Dr00009919 [Drosera rotundifolia]
MRNSFHFMDHSFNLSNVLKMKTFLKAPRYICNGVICMCDHENGVVTFWNPTTAEHSILPYFSDDLEGGYTYAVGFGFVRWANEFMVVRIMEEYSGCHVFPSAVQVCTQSSKTWRNIRLDMQPIMGSLLTGVNAGGAYHWPVLDKEEMEWCLLTFDMEIEVLQWTDLLAIPMDLVLYALEQKESLALVTPDFESVGVRFEVWLNAGDHLDVSWIKQYSFKSSSISDLYPTLLWADGIFLASNKPQELIYHDVHSSEETNVCLDIDKLHQLEIVMSLFRASLLSIKPKILPDLDSEVETFLRFHHVFFLLTEVQCSTSPGSLSNRHRLSFIFF